MCFRISTVTLISLRFTLKNSVLTREVHWINSLLIWNYRALDQRSSRYIIFNVMSPLHSFQETLNWKGRKRELLYLPFFWIIFKVTKTWSELCISFLYFFNSIEKLEYKKMNSEKTFLQSLSVIFLVPRKPLILISYISFQSFFFAYTGKYKNRILFSPFGGKR